jgi:hypothetical protein
MSARGHCPNAGHAHAAVSTRTPATLCQRVTIMPSFLAVVCLIAVRRNAYTLPPGWLRHLRHPGCYYGVRSESAVLYKTPLCHILSHFAVCVKVIPDYRTTRATCTSGNPATPVLQEQGQLCPPGRPPVSRKIPTHAMAVYAFKVVKYPLTFKNKRPIPISDVVYCKSLWGFIPETDFRAAQLRLLEPSGRCGFEAL